MPDAVGEAQVPDAAPFGGVPRFERWGRGAQYERAAVGVRPPQRQLAGVVAEALVALVGAVVFLVDDDDAEILDGSEERGARAHRDRRRTGA